MSLSTRTLAAIDLTAELFRNARRAVVLTGAGISTPSGIPDFRSEGTGLWSDNKAMEAASQAIFRTHPERFFSWFRGLAGQIYHAEPNPAHIALAEMETSGRLHAVITQNIDRLHQKAGSKNVIEMHGTLSTLTCTQCFRVYGYQEYLPAFVEQGTVPLCPSCGAVLKPDVILFGEQLPQKAWFEAQHLCRDCDLMLVVGSSLEVLPVAGLPMQAIDRGAHLVVLNQSPTYLDVRADAVIADDVAVILPAIQDRI